MKERISPEVDQLMWLVAEDAEPKAINDFGVRFPDLRGELMKRVEMVRTLRGAKEPGHHVDRIPAFSMRKAEPVRINPRLAFIAACCAVAAIGLATYTVISSSRTTAARPPVTPISTAMPTPSPGVVYRNDLPKQPVTASPLPTPTPEPSPTTGLPNLPVYLTPQDFTFHNTKLRLAIQTAAMAGNLNVEIAPGLPDMEISESYRQISPVDLLRRLGHDYGFSAFEQESGKVLIIPEVDNDPKDANRPAQTASPSR